MRIPSPIVPALALALATAQGQDLSLHPLWKDGAVVQRDVPLPLTGRARPGAPVTVEWRGRTQTRLADASGRWSVLLPAGPTESRGQTLRVQSGTNSLMVTDLLVGEVWLASGQSNMEWILRDCGAQSAEAAQAADPLLRLVTIPRAMADHPKDDVSVVWQTATPDHVLGWSAVAYFFARELRQTLGVPVGIIACSFGGTPAESWTPEDALAENPRLAPTLEKRRNYPALYRTLQAEYETRKKALREAPPAAGVPPPFPQPPLMVGQNPHLASVLWNAMISPLLPYPIQGVIWYQGEANARQGTTATYEPLLSSLIRAWRKNWRQRMQSSLTGWDRIRTWLPGVTPSPDFPFLIVQLADFDFPPEGPTGTSWARLRDAQATVADKLPRCGLAVTLGLGEAEDIHPQRKKEVGQRLALLARKIAYGQPILCTGPILEAAQANGKEMVLTFRTGQGSLRTSDGKDPGSFSVAGKDRKFYPASARLENLRVILSSPEVAEAAFARYAWSNRPENPNLTDESGLPARPFRTDSDPRP